MSSETSKNVAKKAIAYGACLHLQKPISLNDLKYLWQHVHRNDKDCMTKTRSCGKEFRATKINDAATKPKPADVARNDQFNCITRLKKTCMQHKGSSSKTKRSYDDDDEEKRNDKRIKSKHDPTDSERRETTGTKSKQSSSSRLVWDKELHHKFIAAVNALGDKNARPKSILRMMNEPNLSLRQVASHLQKYKAQVRRNLSSLTNASTSVYDKPGSFSMLLKNKSVLSTHPGHKSSKFSIGDTYRYQDSTAPIGSIYQNQQFQNVAQNMQEKLHATLDSADSFSPLNQTDQLQSMPPYKHQKLNFSVGSDLINSANQTLQLPSLPHYIHQKRNCIPDSTATSISLSQSQVLMSPIQTTQGIDLVVAEYTGKPEAVEPQSETICGNLGVDTTIHNTVPSAIISENQKQNSAELADLVKFLDEEADETRGSCIEPHPSEVDKFCEWLKEAILGNNEQP
ncbi:hypothetical protein PTKIN_Ptkin17bG0061400 [Pterospermum kingtungense]